MAGSPVRDDARDGSREMPGYPRLVSLRASFDMFTGLLYLYSGASRRTCWAAQRFSAQHHRAYSVKRFRCLVPSWVGLATYRWK